LLHEIERRYYDGTTFLRIIAFDKPTNGRVFNKSVGDIVCGGEFIVHQDARYHATTFKTSEKSTALDFISLVACNLLHEMGNR